MLLRIWVEDVNLMDKTWKEQLSDGERKIWENILGKQTLEGLGEEMDRAENWPDASEAEMAGALVRHCGQGERLYLVAWLKEQCFYKFYEPVLGFAVTALEKLVGNQWFGFRENIFEKLMKLLFSRIENVCLRVLVADMRDKKEQGALLGADTHEEYEYYVSAYLGDGPYRRSLLEKYSALPPILWRLMDHFTMFFSDVTEHILDDLPLLAEHFWNGQCPGAVTDITPGTSDAHFGGRCVLRITWDERYTLFYKPRSVKNDAMYQEFYGWLAEACGVKAAGYDVLDRKDHGWCVPVHPGGCGNETQVRTYFGKLGIQLFICYLFSVKDLHYENIMACGAEPFLIDMETFPGLWNFGHGTSIRELALEQINGSVMSTGALPVTIWNFDGQGVRMGALEQAGSQRLPLKVPAVVRGKTSEMEVVLIHPKLEVKGNLPTLNGQPVHPADYVDALTNGFLMAYSFACAHKPLLLEKARAVFAVNSRVLVRNTQQYFMYIQTAANPFFMTAPWRQRLFFCNLYNSTHIPEKWKTAVAGYETGAMLERDIPYFYINGLRTSLFDSKGNEYENYFDASPMEAFRKRLDGLSDKDCMFQEQMIRLTMATLPGAARRFVNTWAPKPDILNPGTKESFLEGAKTLGRGLLAAAVTDAHGRELIWPALKYFGLSEMDWRLDVQNMYLYDGLAGTGLFFAALGWLSGETMYLRAFRRIREQLFDYTAELLEKGCPKDAPTGIFNGEASLIYVYLIFHQLFHDPIYLIYARKHSEIVETIYKEDKNCDLISGNAGLIAAWIHLFDVTGENHYLELAREAGELLCGCAQPQPRGKGWNIAGEAHALAGMAHGNSGFILALSRLCQRAPSPRLEKLLEDLLEYEDSLFDETVGNWRDLRSVPAQSQEKEPSAGGRSVQADSQGAVPPERGQRAVPSAGGRGVQSVGNDAVAWCHGAPGILLSRLELQKNCPALKPEMVARDIRLARKKLQSDVYRAGFCLCHGNCGTGWIAVKCAESSGNPESHEAQALAATLTDVLGRIKSGELLPQEKYNPGFMTGMSGIGYTLLSQCCPLFPNVLAVEIKVDKTSS